MTRDETKQGYYSLIQFCPNPERAEVANVGVVLILPKLRYLGRRARARSYLGSRFAETESCVVRAMLARAGIDAALLADAKLALASRFEKEREILTSILGLAGIAFTRGDIVVLTVPRSVEIRSPGPDAELDRLFKELVA